MVEGEAEEGEDEEEVEVEAFGDSTLMTVLTTLGTESDEALLV